MAELRRRILWADDEIEFLKPHILFLKDKGYDVTPVSNGRDAVEKVRTEAFEAVLLDEMMPGMGGLETLDLLKQISPGLPVILVTKSEEEQLMEDAIGRRISGYLIKPVNPTQIQLELKRVLEGGKLEDRRLTRDFVAELTRIRTTEVGGLDWRGWMQLYRRIVEWELELESLRDRSLADALAEQKRSFNLEFGRYVEQHYGRWVRDKANPDRPVLSVDVVGRVVVPRLLEGRQVALLVIDCLRLDQWLALEKLLEPHFDIKCEEYYSILPTATPYSRNALFSGLTPLEMHRQFPEHWSESEGDEGSKNRHERFFLEQHLGRLGVPDAGNLKYFKVYTAEEGMSVRRQVGGMRKLPLVAMVYNFVDTFSHGRSEVEILQEFVPDEAAFRAHVATWFNHSSLFDTLRQLAVQDVTVVVTTDHGSILAKRSALVKANRETSTSLRYKYGNNLVCDDRQSMHIKNPAECMLPDTGLNKHYLMAKEDFYFVYRNRFHEYERQYRGSFQHGGISMEEMILPLAVLEPRKA
ncbi:MAG: PglZ domain-containing protein [Candidatus Eisenbacteria bacterium]|nr:PglZ domain-containing protein [Candidatus Eisenbacteria bacterium]